MILTALVNLAGFGGHGGGLAICPSANRPSGDTPGR